jgi:CheY-like chemotaxis protein
MLTANAFAEDAAASLGAGCDAFLTKPVMPADIYGALDRFLGATEGPAVRGAA